jgi:hypothetical protein
MSQWFPEAEEPNRRHMEELHMFITVYGASRRPCRLQKLSKGACGCQVKPNLAHTMGFFRQIPISFTSPRFPTPRELETMHLEGGKGSIGRNKRRIVS